MAITDRPEGERPREKLLQQGVAALSDAELLAIFLRMGVKGKVRWIWRATCLPVLAALMAFLLPAVKA